MTKQLLPVLFGGKNLNLKIKLVSYVHSAIEVQMIAKDFIYSLTVIYDNSRIFSMESLWCQTLNKISENFDLI